MFTSLIPTSSALPLLENANWVLPSDVTEPVLRQSVDLALARSSMMKGPYLQRFNLRESMFKIGAMDETSLTSTRVANSSSHSDFDSRLQRSYEADKALQHALLSKKRHMQLAKDVSQFAAASMLTPNISMTLGEWAAKVKPAPLDDISKAFRKLQCPMYHDMSYGTVLFCSMFHPVSTAWLPRRPNQVQPPGFNPRCNADLYEHDTTVFDERETSFEGISYDLHRYFALGSSEKRTYRTYSVWPQSRRKPQAQGLIYDNRDPDRFFS